MSSPKIWMLGAAENWICDRLVNEFYTDNKDIVTPDPGRADIIWNFANWRWRHIAHYMHNKKVLTTIHHIVPQKFDKKEQIEFELCDRLTHTYHVYNERTYEFIQRLTSKPIVLIPYWVNQNIWFPIDNKFDLRKKYKIPQDAYVIFSAQRDTEGSKISQGIFEPKLEKGPDILCDYIEKISKTKKIHVILAGWRRQYVISRLKQANIPHTYFELPKQNVLNELYNVADLYPIAARYEGGPQAFLEATLCKVKMISTPVGIAEQVLSSEAINTDLMKCIPEVGCVDHMKIPVGYEPYRKLLLNL